MDVVDLGLVLGGLSSSSAVIVLPPSDESSSSLFSTEIAAGTFGCGDQKFFRKGMQLTPVGREAGALRPGAAGQGESPVGGSRGGGGTKKRVSL